MSTAIISRLVSVEPVVKKQVELNNGVLMPILGFGTFRIKGYEVIHSVLDTALQAGYRLIDTATVYQNEEDIGLALEKLLPKYNLKREDIFITSKLAPSDHGNYDVVSKAVKLSLKKLRTSYIDLYLIHWPGLQKTPSENDDNLKGRSESWAALSKIYLEDKTLRSIGVSNYTSKHLNQLLSKPSAVVPVVNQVEFHPYWQQSDEFHEIHNKANIIPQAYCSLGGSSVHKLLEDPIVKTVAEENKFTSAQILLRWALQRGYAVIPKSVTAGRIQENADINFSLSDGSMTSLSNIKTSEKFAWNPDVVS
ncbi:unnamed protein product [Bemisia tabaci]|uniref:NADP-dependent oxidoreductase domain-containing protein n=1 Tax=Bemisia tabaci TaxID=7038 RepID=A0A9P0AAS4_BEMTA|nr:unnamed protein product [Bemisia tabaci]